MILSVTVCQHFSGVRALEPRRDGGMGPQPLRSNSSPGRSKPASGLRAVTPVIPGNKGTEVSGEPRPLGLLSTVPRASPHFRAQGQHVGWAAGFPHVAPGDPRVPQHEGGSAGGPGGKLRQPRPSHRLGKAEDGLHMVICSSGLLPDFRAQREASSGQWLVSLGWKHMRILVTLNVN